ncbi:hypothetical protein Tco_0542699 [Tanacetum coccineum]
MNPLIAQQRALDDALVAHDDPFFTTADVPEIYMHQFWSTINKIPDSSSYRFKLDKRRFKVDVEVIHVVLQICPQIHNQDFVEPPNHEETVAFIKELGYQGELESITALLIDKQQSTTFRRSNIPYPRFTKAIIRYFISKDKTISIRNNLFIHGVKDDSVLGFLKFVSKYGIRQVNGKLIPDVLMSREMLESKAYQTYLDYATGKVIPKESRKRTKAHISSLTDDEDIISEDPDDAEKPEAIKPMRKARKRAVTEKYSKMPTTKRKPTGVLIRYSPDVSVSKKKAPALIEKNKGEGTGFQLGVPYEPKGKSIDTHEGTDLKPGALNVSKANVSESENESWGVIDREDDKDLQSDDERTNSDNQEMNEEEEGSEDEFVHTLEDYVPTDEETNDVDDDEYKRINEELYGDVNVNLTNAELNNEDEGDAEMADATQVHVEETQRQIIVVQEETSLEVVSDQVHDKAQATITAAPATKNATTEVPSLSSSHSVSSNYVGIFLKLDNLQSAEAKVVFMLDIDVQHETPSTQTLLLLSIPVTGIPEPYKSYKEVIDESVQAHIINKVQKQLPPFVPTAVSDFVMTSNNVTFIASFIPLIMEYLVKISKKARILELKRRNIKKSDSDIQYAVSIKEDTAYMCLHFAKDHEGN